MKAMDEMNGNLAMNNRGLRGTGTINFLAASVTANDFVFYPDSVTAKGTDAKIDRKAIWRCQFSASLTYRF